RSIDDDAMQPRAKPCTLSEASDCRERRAKRRLHDVLGILLPIHIAARDGQHPRTERADQSLVGVVVAGLQLADPRGLARQIGQGVGIVRLRHVRLRLVRTSDGATRTKDSCGRHGHGASALFGQLTLTELFRRSLAWWGPQPGTVQSQEFPTERSPKGRTM